MTKQENNLNRAQFATRLGVIAATVGSAIGLGNIWRFPYEVGTNGGAAFLLVYIGCVLILGIPVITAEFLIGRSTHRNAHRAVAMLASQNKYKIHRISYLYFISILLLLGFYSVVAGWIMQYLYQALAGNLSAHTPAEYTAMFDSLISNPVQLVTWTVLFLLCNYVVIRGGIEKGIERVSNVMMPIFFILLVIFCVKALSMSGAKEGLIFLFKPDWHAVTPSLLINALGQSFMSLSIGVGTLITYASYFSDDTQILRTSGTVVTLDTLVAMLAGLIIFPILFSFGGEVTAGPKLVFEVLPNLFQQMNGSYLWAVGFFLLLFMASITSTISMSEVCITYMVEDQHLSRRKACTWLTVVVIAIAVLCALSFNVLSDVHLFGKTIFDFCDYTVSNVLMPIGGLFSALVAGWLIDRQVIQKQLAGKDGQLSITAKVILFLLRYVAPALITIIFIAGL